MLVHRKPAWARRKTKTMKKKMKEKPADTNSNTYKFAVASHLINSHCSVCFVYFSVRPVLIHIHNHILAPVYPLRLSPSPYKWNLISPAVRKTATAKCNAIKIYPKVFGGQRRCHHSIGLGWALNGKCEFV